MRNLTFATGPVHLDEDGDELRDRLSRLLSLELQRRVLVRPCRSYGDVRKMVAEGRADMAWLPPAIYVQAEADPGLQLLAGVERSQGDGYRGVLFVKTDSPYEKPEDLRGTKIAWVDQDSCAGHIFVRAALQDAGLDPAQLFDKETFEGSHGRVVLSVMGGVADVGATHAQMDPSTEKILLAGWHPWAGATAMRPLLFSASIPADVICSPKDADEGLVTEMREGLLNVYRYPRATNLLDEFFGGCRLVGASSEDYDPIRKVLEG